MTRVSDEDRILAIEALLGAGKIVPEGEVIWLCRRLRGFAIPRLDEFDFPEYCGLIGASSDRAVAVRQLRKPRIEKEIRAGSAHAIVAIDHVVNVPVTDAIVVVRPWVKVMLPPGNRRIEDFVRNYQLKLSVDHRVIGEAPVGEFVMSEDGIGLKTMRPKLLLSPEHQVVRAALMDEAFHTVTPDQTFGMGLLNGQRVQVLIECLGSDVVPDLLVGLAAAQYTSRSAANGTSTDLPAVL